MVAVASGGSGVSVIGVGAEVAGGVEDGEDEDGGGDSVELFASVSPASIATAAARGAVQAKKLQAPQTKRRTLRRTERVPADREAAASGGRRTVLCVRLGINLLAEPASESKHQDKSGRLDVVVRVCVLEYAIANSHTSIILLAEVVHTICNLCGFSSR